MSDATLLSKWRNERDAQAFAAIVAKYSGMVYATCRRVLNNPEAAQEVAQDCFAVLAESPLKEGLYLGPWLHRVATYRSLNRIKGDQRRCARENRYAEQQAAALQPTWDDVREHVDEAIALLPERLRRPVILHFLEGKTQAAVAEELGVPRTTVSARIARGTDLIRKALHRRGVIVASGALAGMLGAKTADAAPAALIAALGRFALAGARPAVAGLGPSGLGVITQGAVLLAVSLALAGVVYVFGSFQPAHTSKDNSGSVATADLGPMPSQQQDDQATTPAAPADAAKGSQVAPQPVDASAFTGCVVDEAGNSVADAVVALSAGEEALATARTDDKGRFRLEGTASKARNIYAFRNGVGLAIAENVDPADEMKPLALEPLGCVAGRVFDKNTGQGIPGFALELGPFPVPEGAVGRACWALKLLSDLHTETEQSGQFRVEDLAPTKYLFRSDGLKSEYVFPGYRAPALEMSVGKGERRENIEIALEKGAAISGTVYGPDGHPAAAIRIRLTSTKHCYFGDFQCPNSGEDGKYRACGLPLDASYTVIAAHDDYATTASDPVNVVQVGEVAGIDIRMTRGHSVYGRLSDDAGRPIVGAQIATEEGYGSRADTGPNGEFVLAHVGAGEQRVSVFQFDETQYEWPITSFLMPGDRNLRDLSLTLKRKTSGTISGRVTDTEGAPLAGLRVQASGKGEVNFVDEEVTTGLDGRYAFRGLGAAEFCHLNTYPRDGGFAMESIEGVAVGSTGVDFKLSRFGKVAGRVVDAGAGKPVTEFEVRHVRFTKVYDNVVERESNWFPTSSSEGAFLLEDVAPPLARVEVRAAGYADGAADGVNVGQRETTKDIVIALSKGVRFAGRVTDAATGEPLAGVNIRIYKPQDFHPMLLDASQPMRGGTLALTTSDSDGRFEARDLAPGQVNLIAWHSGYGALIVPSVTVDKDSAGDVELVMAAEGRLSIDVTDNGQLPEDCACVIRQQGILPEQAAYSYGLLIRRDADRTGPIELAGLPAGSFTITFTTLDGQQIGGLEAEVTADQTTQIKADLAHLNVAGEPSAEKP